MKSVNDMKNFEELWEFFKSVVSFSMGEFLYDSGLSFDFESWMLYVWKLLFGRMVMKLKNNYMYLFLYVLSLLFLVPFWLFVLDFFMFVFFVFKLLYLVLLHIFVSVGLAILFLFSENKLKVYMKKLLMYFYTFFSSIFNWTKYFSGFDTKMKRLMEVVKNSHSNFWYIFDLIVDRLNFFFGMFFDFYYISKYNRMSLKYLRKVEKVFYYMFDSGLYGMFFEFPFWVGMMSYMKYKNMLLKKVKMGKAMNYVDKNFFRFFYVHQFEPFGFWLTDKMESSFSKLVYDTKLDLEQTVFDKKDWNDFRYWLRLSMWSYSTIFWGFFFLLLMLLLFVLWAILSIPVMILFWFVQKVRSVVWWVWFFFFKK